MATFVIVIDHGTIERILDTAEISDVVSDFVTLRKRGVNMLGLCPFHNEKTPSFTVSPAKGIYKCFGCGRGGNSVNFIMEHENLSYPEALKWLAKKYNIEVRETEESQKYKQLQARSPPTQAAFRLIIPGDDPVENKVSGSEQ